MLRLTLKIIISLTALCLIIAAIAPFFIPAQKYHGLIEDLVSASMGREVKIASIKYQVFPLPHIEGNNIVITSGEHAGEAVIAKLSIWFNYGELAALKPKIEHLHFDGVATNQLFIESFKQQNTEQHKTSSSLIRIGKISASSVSIRDNENKLLPAINFAATFTDESNLPNINISLLDHDIHADISAITNNQFSITLQGRNIKHESLPFALDKVRANAIYEDKKLSISDFQIDKNTSTLSGNIKLDHSNPNSWLTSGTFRLANVDLSLLNSFIKNATTQLAGEISAELNFASFAPELKEINQNLIIKGQFSANNASIAHDATRFSFEKISANTHIEDNTAQFSQVKSQLYDGHAQTTDITLSWGKQWKINTVTNIDNIDFGRLSADLFGTAPLVASASCTCAFTAKAATLGELGKQLHIAGDALFNVPRIIINSESNTSTLAGFKQLELSQFKYQPQRFNSKNLHLAGYDGDIDAANFSLSWEQQWILSTKVTSQNFSLGPLLKDLNQAPTISGHLSGSHTINATADQFSALIDVIDLSGDFKLIGGEVRFAEAPDVKTFKFDKISTTAQFNREQAIATNILINAYGGSIRAKDFHIGNHENEWALFTKLEGSDVALGPLLKDVANQHFVDGSVSGHVTLALNGPELGEILQRVDAKGAFYVVNGKVYNTDIEQAVSMTASSTEKREGESTSFSELSSTFDIVNNRIDLAKFRIHSNTLSGKGDITIMPDHTIKGALDVAISSTGSLLQVPLNVSGTMDEPELALTGGALVGSAVGTSLLGPGLGTIIGLHTGKLFTGIGNLFSREAN